MKNNFDIKKIIELALKEDMPAEDITTEALATRDFKGVAKLVAKSKLVLSGLQVFNKVFKQTDSKTKLQWKFKDGQKIPKGAVVCVISGSLPHLLKAERVALNFLGKLSGIATLTAEFVSQTQNTKTKILDTRKTTPLFRALEKKAVLDGGGKNHRMNLSDAFLIKENHIRMSGGITQAVALCRKKNPHKKIEVETLNLSDVKEALKAKVDRVMLDNMSLKLMKEAVALINKKCEIEASGNMTLSRIKDVASLGVDFISVGLITHSAPTADLSLLFEINDHKKGKK